MCRSPINDTSFSIQQLLAELSYVWKHEMRMHCDILTRRIHKCIYHQLVFTSSRVTTESVCTWIYILPPVGVLKGDILCKNHFSSSSTLIYLNSGCVQPLCTLPFLRRKGESELQQWPTPGLHPPRPTGYKTAKLR